MAALLLVGLVMIWLTKMMMGMELSAGHMETKTVNMETGIVVVALLFPLLAYALAAGLLEELTFGQVKVKLLRAADTVMSLPKPGEMTLDHDAFNQVGQEGPGKALEQMIIQYDLSEARPIVLNIVLGNTNYTRQTLLDFIRQLHFYRSFRLIVFLDEATRVKAFMPSWAAMKLLSDEEGKGEKFISAITGNRVDQINALDHVVTEPLSSQDTNAEALRRMTKMDLEAFVVVDSYGRLKAVVERDDVVSKMMLALVDKPTPYQVLVCEK